AMSARTGPNAGVLAAGVLAAEEFAAEEFATAAVSAAVVLEAVVLDAAVSAVAGRDVAGPGLAQPERMPPSPGTGAHSPDRRRAGEPWSRGEPDPSASYGARPRRRLDLARPATIARPGWSRR